MKCSGSRKFVEISRKLPMGIFIPKHMRNWKPEHMRGIVMRRDCYMCGEVGLKKIMTSIKEGPMIWHFCNMECACMWAKRRAKKEWRKYLNTTPYLRKSIPISQIPIENDRA